MSIDATGDDAMNRLGTVTTLCLTLVVVACAPIGTSGGASGAPTRTSPTEPADVLVLRDAEGSGATAYVLVDAADDRVLSRLPAGVPASDWHVLYATQSSGASTVIRAIDPVAGTVERETSVAGDWQLPAIGLDRDPGGLSADGRTLVLEEATTGAGTEPSTRFSIVSTAGTTAARMITVPGRLTFDALSPDGRLMYVLDHVSDLTYSVRQIDVASGRLAEGTIVDKRNADERMAGYANHPAPGCRWLGLHAVSGCRGCVHPCPRYATWRGLLHRPARRRQIQRGNRRPVGPRDRHDSPGALRRERGARHRR